MVNKYVNLFFKMLKSLKAQKKKKFQRNREAKNYKLDGKTFQFEKPCSNERKLKDKKYSSFFIY